MNTMRRFRSMAQTPRRFPNASTWPIGGQATQGIELRRCNTQAEQDEVDEQQRREAMRDLVESWMDRLQLISLITTFFASTEASLLSISSPASVNASKESLSIAGQLANIGLVGALVVHVNAAIISFLAAFFLIRYKLSVAKREEKAAEHKPEVHPRHRSSTNHEKHHTEFVDSLSNDVERSYTAGFHPPQSEHETDPIPGPFRITTPAGTEDVQGTHEIWSRNPHLIQVGPFQSLPPTHLLSRCHNLCIFLSALGFALALMGILSFAWDSMPTSVSASATVFMALCVSAGIVIVLLPDSAEGKISPNIYFIK